MDSCGLSDPSPATVSTAWGRRRPYAIGAAGMLVLAVEIAVVVRFHGGAESPFFATFVLLLLGGGVYLAMPPARFAPLAAAIVLIYALPLALAREAPPAQGLPLKIAIVASGGVAGLLGSVLVWRLERRERAARAALEDANRRLVELDRRKTEFFENISHELRTPLTLNLAPLDLLGRGDRGTLTPEQGRLVELVRNNALRLSDLVNDLLKLAQIEAGHYRPRPEPVRVSEAIREVAAAFERSFEAKRIAFRVDAGRGGLTALLDREALTKIVTNLLANALKYTDAGEVRLAVAERDGEIEIAVSDTGIGIPEEAQRHLCERFCRADESGRRRGGTGIGLALVKTLVDAEGGRIACESRVGEGTTFRVFLPLRPVAPPEPADAAPVAPTAAAAAPALAAPRAAPAAAPPATAAAPAPPSRPHVAARCAEVGRGPHAILVVEDDPELAEFLVSLLSARYRVRWAAGGVEGLATARAMRPDLILADVALPRMDGLDLTRAAKEDPALSDVPVLILSARADVADFVAGYEAGAVDYMTKPFAPDVLESKIRALVKIRLLQQTLVARERLAAVGEVLVTLAHEVNNALTAVVAGAQLLEQEPLGPAARANVQSILAAAGRIARTLKKLSDLRDARPTTYVGATRMIAIE